MKLLKLRESCLQSVKDTKFESNSQHNVTEFCCKYCCLQSVKDTKFESNSQRIAVLDACKSGCLQSVKDTKFESNSQPCVILPPDTYSCLQSVKDTKFESNSQRWLRVFSLFPQMKNSYACKFTSKGNHCPRVLKGQRISIQREKNAAAIENKKYYCLFFRIIRMKSFAAPLKKYTASAAQITINKPMTTNTPIKVRF